MKDKPAIINRFSFTGFMGKIDLKNPEEEFQLIADYGIDPNVKVAHTFYMGRLVRIKIFKGKEVATVEILIGLANLSTE